MYMFFRKKSHKKDPCEGASTNGVDVNQEDDDDVLEQSIRPVVETAKPGRHLRRMGMLTDIGRKRKIDEDSIMAAEVSTSVNLESSTFHILVVADGMGGHAKGEEASKIALNAVSRTAISGLLDGVSFTRLLEEGIQNANSDILEQVEKNPQSQGMGTTAVCAIVKDDDVHLANIGDSRAYAISKDEIRRVTKDHSYVQMLVDEGKITEEQAQNHPKKNVILQAIGAGPTAEPDMMQLKLAGDEHLLLCCDGVMAHLSDDDIQNAVTKHADPQDACQSIVDTANERGGTDNISVVLLSPSNGS